MLWRRRHRLCIFGLLICGVLVYDYGLYEAFDFQALFGVKRTRFSITNLNHPRNQDNDIARNHNKDESSKINFYETYELEPLAEQAADLLKANRVTSPHLEPPRHYQQLESDIRDPSLELVHRDDRFRGDSDRHVLPVEQHFEDQGTFEYDYADNAYIREMHPELFVKVRRNKNFDRQCRVGLAPRDSLQFIPLLSFPGSGNTWVRFLVEQATGFTTTSAETGDPGLAPHFKGEYDYPLSGKNILMKTHFFGWVKYYYPQIEDTQEAKYCVFLMRNPINAFLAEFQRIETQANHTGFIPKSQFFTSYYTNKFKRFVWKQGVTVENNFFDTFRKAVQESCSRGYHTLFYENLKDRSRLPTEIKKLTSFLQKANTRVHIPFRQHCISDSTKPAKESVGRQRRHISLIPPHYNKKRHKAKKARKKRKQKVAVKKSQGFYRRKQQDFKTADLEQLISLERRRKLNRKLMHLNHTLGYVLPSSYLFSIR